ncbi:hypothetical protein [Hyphomonas sp.]|uniref:hypothetical protein n=1 Tax=Hyphomonas sp. TaxID=87 RepID=UPI001BCBC71F|nr:hypothetical protein [Hyphomonas sp.]
MSSKRFPVRPLSTWLQRLLMATGLALGTQQVAASDPAFRVRSDLQAPLNGDTGWAGEQSEAVLQPADQPFRLRFEAEAAETNPQTFRLQARRNGEVWETLEAHGFPKPERKVHMTFEDQDPGALDGWTLLKGASEALTVVAAGSDAILRINGSKDGFAALYPSPWPLTTFSYAVEFRLAPQGSPGFAMLFAYADSENYARVQVEPELIKVSQVQQGQERVMAERKVFIEPGIWLELEIQLEGGSLQVSFDDDTLEFIVPTGTALWSGDVGISADALHTADLRELVLEGEPRSPLVSIAGTTAYADADATTDLLSGSKSAFVPGFGLSLSEDTPLWGGKSGHGEFEWPLVIRRLADGALMNEAGDKFEFRMIEAGGLPVAGAAVAQIVLTVPDGHLGGTFVETPGRIGPWQAGNGDLYFIMEPSETDNRFMMMKSADGGKTWREVDGANRPETGDLESVDSRQVGDSIHIIHQVTHSVRYHVFNTSDHPNEPDRWSVRDEVAATATAIAQMATLVVRPDGSLVTVFLADRLYMASRSPDGQWEPATELDPADEYGNAGPQAVLGTDGVVHLAYLRTDGTVWYRRVEADGSLGARQRLATGAGTSRAEYGAVLPLVYDPTTDTTIIIYRLEDGHLWERRVRGMSPATPAVKISGLPVITNAVDAQQPAADVVLDGSVLHLLFIDEHSRQIFATHDAGGWQPPTVMVEGIEGSWVRGNILNRPDGRRAYGYIYDAGSRGGSGMNRFNEIILDQQ